MRKCDNCKKIIWPWQESFYYQFTDIKKQLCSGCFCGMLEFTHDILATQRDFFLNNLLKHELCAKGCSLDDCEILDIDCSTPREELCSKCWCNLANESKDIIKETNVTK